MSDIDPCKSRWFSPVVIPLHESVAESPHLSQVHPYWIIDLLPGEIGIIWKCIDLHRIIRDLDVELVEEVVHSINSLRSIAFLWGKAKLLNCSKVT